MGARPPWDTGTVEPAVDLDALHPPERLDAAREAAAAAGLDALLLGPGAQLRHLTGYEALPLERLTCLVVPAHGPAALVVPRLEVPRAAASPVSRLPVDVVGWEETEDPYALVAGLLVDAGVTPAAVAVGDRMWAEQALALGAALRGARLSTAGPVLRDLRIRKTPAEVEALRRAGAAVDRVHERIATWELAGRRERDVAASIGEALLEEGHARVNFTIVASGPNGASPHHESGDRTVEVGDTVVVDIGGTTALGYCSDSTRTYAVGRVPDGVEDYYAPLRAAQEAGVAAVRPGVAASAVDAACRDLLTGAGWGEEFVHRTGHGIGLEEHEEPWVVAGNDEPLQEGMCFSVEPGVYLPDRSGARIEDCVVVTADGVERLNTTRTDLVVTPG